LRAGIDYHPLPRHMAWQVGLYVEGAFTVIGDESSQDYQPQSRVISSLWLLGGLRTSVAF
jgi:hypothetical protein